jgi:hypothetical protein
LLRPRLSRMRSSASLAVKTARSTIVGSRARPKSRGRGATARTGDVIRVYSAQTQRPELRVQAIMDRRQLPTTAQARRAAPSPANEDLRAHASG